MYPVDDVPGGNDGELDELLGAAAVGNDHVLGGAKGLQLTEVAQDHALIGIADPATDPIDQDGLVLLDEARRRLGARRSRGQPAHSDGARARWPPAEDL